MKSYRGKYWKCRGIDASVANPYKTSKRRSYISRNRTIMASDRTDFLNSRINSLIRSQEAWNHAEGSKVESLYSNIVKTSTSRFRYPNLRCRIELGILWLDLGSGLTRGKSLRARVAYENIANYLTKGPPEVTTHPTAN